MMAPGNILPSDFKMMVVSPFAMYTMGIGSLPIVVAVERNTAFGLFHQRQRRIIISFVKAIPSLVKHFMILVRQIGTTIL